MKNLFVKLVLPVFFSIPVVFYGQEAQSYLGSKQVGKFKGKANYTYKVVEGDTILEGPFRMQRSSLEALLKDEDASFLFEGAFKEDYPNGYWRFQFGEFESDSKSEVVDYQYRVSISGIQEEANGFIKLGKPDGQWTYTVNQIEDSEVEKTLFKSSIAFDNGIPQKNFRIENKNGILVGRFLRSGLAHDEWSFFTNDGLGAAESWSFSDGVLQRIQIQKNEKTSVVPVFQTGIKQTKVINLDARYIKTLELQKNANDTINVYDSGMPGLLAENAKYYQKIDTILSELGKSAFLPEFKVKVPYFPLDSTEASQVDAIRIDFRKSRTISDSLLNNSQLNILKLSDKESLFLYSVVNELSENFIGPLEKLVDYDNQDILEFVARNQLMAQLWPEGKPSVEIKIDKEKYGIGTDRMFVLPDAGRFDFDGNTVASVQQIARYTALSLDSVQHVLYDKLTKEQRQQELITYEEKLIAQSKGLNRLIDSLSGDPRTKVYKDALKNIGATADKQLSDYSSMKETTIKLERARVLVDCYTRMNSLAAAVAVLPDQMEEIKNSYEDAIWNPFMATVMNEEVKKRITTAYRKVLAPHFIEQLEKNLSCDNARELLVKMQNTYDRMLQLRDEDTSKLERKLRKEQDPEIVLQLFGLQSLNKEN